MFYNRCGNRMKFSIKCVCLAAAMMMGFKIGYMFCCTRIKNMI